MKYFPSPQVKLKMAPHHVYTKFHVIIRKCTIKLLPCYIKTTYRLKTAHVCASYNTLIAVGHDLISCAVSFSECASEEEMGFPVHLWRIGPVFSVYSVVAGRLATEAFDANLLP